MSRPLKARYEAGVFRPLDRVDLPDGATVEVTIAPAGWDERLRALLDRVRARAGAVSADDVEAEITRAAEEVRAERLAGA